MNAKLPSLVGLSIERLKTFCLVAEEGSIVAAARDDATRQSQYSRQIKQLEEAVGDKLFLREGKKLLLTKAGRKLALVTKGYFSAVEEIRSDAANEPTLLRLGAAESVFRWILLPRLNEIMSSNPGLRFEFHTLRTNEAVEQVKEGRLDLAIVRTDAVEEPLFGISVGFLDFVWVVPRNLLPEKSSAGVHIMEELPIALLTGDGKLAKAVMEVAAQNQIKISIKVFADNFGLIVEALQTGGLGAVIPAPAAKDLSNERFSILEMPGMERLRRNLSLVYDTRIIEIRDSIKRVANRIIKGLSI